MFQRTPEGEFRMDIGIARGRGMVAVGLALGMLLALALPARAGAAECNRAGDAESVAELVAAARVACSCESFTSRQSFKACVRGVIDDAIATSSMARRCRAKAMRYARTATCGARAGKVTCCKNDGRSCTLAESAARCEASRGGTGQVGSTESCYDACAEAPMPTPGPTPDFPTPTPGRSGQCCACGCRPPYYFGCPGSAHQCLVRAPDATSNDDCDAFDVPGGRDCEVIVACSTTIGGIPFPYCN